MWHVYPSADQPEAYSSVTGSNKATFNPGDVVNMVHGVLLFGKTSQYEFFDYELQHIDVLDISESETHFLDSIIDDNFP